jgi:aspartate aminotransferase
MRVDTRLAERLRKISPSATLAITSKAKKLKSEGRDVISFAAGEPDFDTPAFIKDAAVEALKSGFTKYTPTTGIPELKKAIAEKFQRDNLLQYQSEQIIVSCGAKHSIFNALMVLVDKDEEVLIPSPYWVSYPEMVKLCEATPRFVKTLPENNFKINPKELNKYIGPKTKALILNSPSNPSGCVYSREELLGIARICLDKKIFIISDEIYEKLVYDNSKHISIAGLNKDIYDLTITVNGLSKSYSMTGWRIGYLGAPLDIAEAISRLQDHSTSNPNSIAQKASVAALNASSEFSDNMRREFQKRRDYMLKRLAGIDKIKAIKPEGAFYIFCDISRTKLTSLAFASRALDDAGIAVIPGESFGRDDYVRFSFATSLEQIEKGMDKLAEWVNKL